jgi:hypothetical protein
MGVVMSGDLAVLRRYDMGVVMSGDLAVLRRYDAEDDRHASVASKRVIFAQKRVTNTQKRWQQRGKNGRLGP